MTPWCHWASVLIEASLPAMTPWAGNGRRPATPHPPGDAVPSMEHLRAPRLTSHTSLFPSECVSVTGPVQTLAGTAGMPAAAWGSAGLSWVSHGCPRCPSAPALIPGVGCSPKPLQKLRLMVGDAALGPWAAPRVHCKPVARLQAAGLGPRGFGAPRFPGSLRAGGGLASPQPGVPWTVRLPGTQHCGSHTQEAALGPILPGHKFLQGAGYGAHLGACPGDAVPKVQHPAPGSSEA